MRLRDVFTSVIAVVALGLLAEFGVYLAQPFSGGGALQLDLRHWEFCSSPDGGASACSWAQTELPSAIPESMGSDRGHWFLFRTRFETPSSCLNPETSCALILGEVGDAVEARLNGYDLGRHGGFPPHPFYAPRYPVRFDLSRDLLKRGSEPNEIELTVYAMKRYAAGIVRGPVGIVPSKDSIRVVQRLVASIVVMPVIAAVGLYLLALVAFLYSRSDPGLSRFIWYCFAAGAYSLSNAQIPREQLSVAFVGFFHFTNAILFGWAQFELIATFFSLRARVRPIHALYGAALAAFAGQWLAGRSFDEAILTARILTPLWLLPLAVGLLLALRLEKARERWILSVTFALLLACQVSDTLSFLGITDAQLTVRFTPLVLGLAFGWIFLERHQEEQRKLLASSAIARMSLQVAHDIRSPLAALRVLQQMSSSLPEEHRRLLQMSVNRVSDIAARLLTKYSAASARADGVLRPWPLAAILHDVVTEQRFARQDRSRARIEIELPPSSLALCARVDRAELSRVLSNLVNNAVEAVPSDAPAHVRIALHADPGHATIRISDNGRGLDDARLAAFNAHEFGESSKRGGHGLGLTHAWNTLREWGGELRFGRAEGGGTEVTLSLCAEPAPSWLCARISIPPGAEIHVLDDDPAVHEAWRSRLSSREVHHFTRYEEFRRGFEARDPTKAHLVLIDYELLGEPLDGIEIIRRHGLESSAVLVSATVFDSTLAAKIAAAKIRFLPKDFVPIVEIVLS